MSNWQLDFRDNRILGSTDAFLAPGIRAELIVECPDWLDFSARIAMNERLPAKDLPLGGLKGQLQLFRADRRSRPAFIARLGVRLGWYSSFEALARDVEEQAGPLGWEGIASPAKRYFALLLEQAGEIDGQIVPAAKILGALLDYQAEGELLVGVVRGYEFEPPLQDALASLFGHCGLPSWIRSPDQLEPLTWIIGWRRGTLAVNLYGQAQHELAWWRRLGLGPWKGELGVQVEPRLNFSAEVQAEGEQLCVVHRGEGQRKRLRVRFCKAEFKNAQVAVVPTVGLQLEDNGLLPGTVEEFAKAMAGVLGVQWLEELWSILAHPPSETFEKLRRAVVRWLAQRTHQAEPIVEAELETLRATWSGLPVPVRNLLWRWMSGSSSQARDSLQEDLRLLLESNQARVQSLLEALGQRMCRARTPFTLWLEAAAEKTLWELLGQASSLESLCEIARRSLVLLSSNLLGGLYELLEGYASRAGLAAQQAAPEWLPIEEWVRSKLADLSRQRSEVASWTALAELTSSVREKLEGAYQRARSLLQRQLQLSIEMGWSKARSSTVLLDATFDFDHSTAAETFLQAALRGDWRGVLTAPPEVVELHMALLTHGLRRYHRIRWQLPSFEGTLEHWNQAFARMEIREEDGRLVVCEAEASDTIRLARRWASELALGCKARLALSDRESLAQLCMVLPWRYTFRSGTRRLRARALENRLRPLSHAYFSRPNQERNAEDWLGDWVWSLQRQAESALGSGQGTIGDTLVELQVELPGDVAAAFFLELADWGGKSQWMEISRAIQHALRRVVPYCYFTEAARYAGAEFDVAAALLVYQAMPVTTAIELEDGRVRFNTDRSPYWDYRDGRQRHAMVFNTATERALLEQMGRVRQVLEDDPALRRWAALYAPENLRRVQWAALQGVGGKLLVDSLLWSEASLIERLTRVARHFQTFRTRLLDEPQGATRALEQFAAELAETFHRRLTHIVGTRLLRQLSSVVFLEAARVVAGGLEAVRPSAWLRVHVLKPGAFDQVLEEFLRSGSVESMAVVVTQVLTT